MCINGPVVKVPFKVMAKSVSLKLCPDFMRSLKTAKFGFCFAESFWFVDSLKWFRNCIIQSLMCYF